MAIYSGKFHHGTPTTYSGFGNDKLLGNNPYLKQSAVFQTDLASSSASAATEVDFMSVYASGHWGQQPVFDIVLYTTYYRPNIIGWRCCMNYNQFCARQIQFGSHSGANTNSSFSVDSGTPHIEIYNSSTSKIFDKNTADDSTSGYNTQVGSGTHGGQSVFRQDIKFQTAGPYYQTQAIITVYEAGGSQTAAFSNSTAANVSSNRASAGSGFHFKTISPPTDYFGRFDA